MPFHERLGCSTITFRRLPLAQALSEIRDLGFDEIDLGALPGVCDHVPYRLDKSAVAQAAAEVHRFGLGVRSVNGDIGDLNRLLDQNAREDRQAHLSRLLELTEAVGARALVLPNGALDHEPMQTVTADIAQVVGELELAAGQAAGRGLELWVESLHLLRLCHNIERAQLLSAAVGPGVGVVLDTSHVVASGSDPVEFVQRFGEQIRHVHLRDATAGNINLSIGNGCVDFGATFEALATAGYDGHFTLELETRDVEDPDRPAIAGAAARYVSDLLNQHQPRSATSASHRTP
jgi:sugar phosphate isomerase/epimerase